MLYTIKNIKSFQGREGLGFECSLYRDGKKVGTVTNTANGGMIDFYISRTEIEKLDSHCSTLPKKPFGVDFPDLDHDSYAVDKDIFISDLVDDFVQNRELKRKCKTWTIFSLYSDTKSMSHWLMKNIFSPKMKTYLQDKYGKNLKEIINERF